MRGRDRKSSRSFGPVVAAVQRVRHKTALTAGPGGFPDGGFDFFVCLQKVVVHLRVRTCVFF